MPIARFQMPDGRIGRFEVPEGLSPEQATSLIEKELGLGAPKPAGPSKERTIGESLTDIYAGLKGGVGSLLQLPSQVAGVVGGEYEAPGQETGLAATGKELQAEAEALKSPGLKAREAGRAEKVAAAEKRGQFDAFMTAFSETLRDPGLLTNFLAEQAPQLIPSLGAARLIKPIAGTAAAVRGAIGTGAVQQGADIAAGTYEQVYKELVKQGATEEEAAGRAIGLARTAGAGAVAISLLAQRLPGAKAIEEAFAGQEGKLGRVLGAGRGALGESISEVAEETPAKALQNYLLQQVAPETSLTAGLGETAAMAALGGAGMGAGVGLAQRQAGAEQVPPQQQPPSQFAPEPEAPPPAPPALPGAAVEPEMPPRLPAPVEAAAPPVEPGMPPVEPAPVEPGMPPAPAMPEPPQDAVAAMQNYWMGSPADFGMSFADIQNRDRTKPASIQQMMSIARQPDYNRLSVSRDFGAGAPVVISDIEIDPTRLGRIDTVSASDGTKIPVQYAVMDARDITPSNRADGTTVDQYADLAFEGIRPVAGNGRIAGLQELYRSGPYSSYVQQMMGDAAHGINPEVISAIEQPVLVRIMPKSALTPDIADKSNVGGQLGMSPTEQAKIDMGRFDLQGIQFLADGSPSLGSLRQFVAAMPKEEQAELMNRQGQPTPLAKLRLSNALFARAYANDALIDLFAETTDPEAQQILRGMAIASPAMSNLSEAGEYDIRPYVTKAAELAVNARRQGVDLSTYIDQGDIELDPLTREVVSMFAANKNAPRRIGDSLVMLAAEANKAAEQASAPPDMFGEAAFKRPLADVFAILRGEPTQVAPIVEEEEAPEKLTYQIGKSEEQIAQEIDGMNVVQVADWLVDNAPNSFAKIVSEAVRSRVKAMQARKIPMTFKLLRGSERKAGVYGAVHGRYKGKVAFDVTINAPTAPGEKAEVVGTEYRTLLHEMLHLATQGQVHIEIGKNRYPTSGPIYELENLRKFIMKKVREDRAAGRPVPIRLNTQQTLLDVHELISYGFTEVEVQQYLASITYKNKNGFTRFVDAIRKLMAINKVDQTAMERLVSLTDEILEVPAKDIAAKLKAAGVRFGVGAIGTPSMTDTRTSEFRKWFGDSKVVDANGEPLVVYHGTDADITKFKISKEGGALGNGIYITPSAEFAGEYAKREGGNVMPLYASIKNPLIIDGSVTRDPMIEALVKLGVDRAKAERIVEKAYDDKGYITNEVKSRAIAQGYDGIMQYRDNALSEIVAFDSAQLKSVFNKRPTESKVITEERDTRTPEFRKWFGKSKVVDQNGEPRVMYHGTVSDFDTFVPDSHFGTARAANQRARSWSAQNGERPMQIMPVYLRIENPLRVMDNEASDEAALLNAIKRGKYPQLDLGIANRDGAYAAAKAAGYDGLVYQNKVEDRNKLSYVAFDPNQIKSIFNQRPTESKVITEERDTRTPEFRKWFGGSKVVDEDGEPKQLYHSTYSDIKAPTTNFGADEYRRFGMHVGSLDAATNRLDVKAAEDARQREASGTAGANILPVYVKAESPLRLDENRTGRWGVDDIMRQIMEKAERGELEGLTDEDVDAWYNDAFDIENWLGLTPEVGSREYDPDREERFWSDTESYFPGERSKLLNAFIRQLGYDSIVYRNEFEGGGDSYLLLDPNQIKSVFNQRPTESTVITEEREAAEELTDPKLRIDNPGGDWLANNKEDNDLKGVTEYGVPKRFGAVTGYLNRTVLLPVDLLARIPGMRAEQYNVREKDLAYIKQYMAEKNKLPPPYGEPDTEHYPPYIQVDQRGRPYVSEGNHRIMAARDLGFKYLPIELRYFTGGEEVDGILSPKKLLEYDRQARAEGYDLKNYGKKPIEERVTTEEREPFADISEGKLETPSRIQDKLEEKWDRMKTGAPKNKPSSFSDVDEDLWKDISGVFFPQNKNIAQKIDGMRDRFWQRLAQGVADQYRTIKDYSPEAYMKARMSKTIDGALEGILFEGEVKLTQGALDIAKDTKGLLKVMEPVGAEVDRYQIWVALQRDAQLVAQGKAPSVSKDIVRRRNELAAGKIGDKSRLEVYQQVQKDMNRLNRSVLRIALQQGIIDREAFNVFARDINYIPFYKVMDEGGSVQAAATKSGLVNQYFSKALQGGEKPFGDLMENTLRNWSHILSASMKNEAANATVKAAMDVGGAFPNLKVGLEWRLDDDGRNGKVYSAKTGEMIGDGSLKPEYTSSDGRGLIKTMIDGKPAYFEIVDPLLLESIMSIGYLGPKSKFLDVARDFKNILQFGVTVSPAFKVRNLIRDSVQSAAVSGIGLNIAKNVTEGIAASKRGNPDYISALAGGAIFNFGSYVEGDQATMIKRLIEQGVKGENILDTEAKLKAGLKRMWDGYQDWGNRSEAANRMALYKQLRAKGFSHLEASFQARDLLDFSMQGSWPAVRMVTQVIPFLNARVQGLYKLGRDGITPTSRVIYNSITGKPIDVTDKQKAQQFSIVTGAVMLASLMLYMSFKDDDEWKKREQWDRDNFWWFKMPGMDAAIRIPKPFEIGAFGTLAERIAEQMMDEGVEGKVFAKSLSRMLTDTFAINPIPQVIKPLVDLYANKDSFTGAPIETAGMERLSKAERVAVGTSPLAKALSKVANVFLPESTELSPVQADYAVKAYLGWMGATISSTSHYAVMPFSKSAYPDHNWAETMSLGFVKSLPTAQSGYVTSFYENMKTISQAYADMRHYAQLGEAEKMREVYEEKGDKIMLANMYDQTSKDMAKMRQVIQVIQRDENMSGAQKKEEIDRLKMLIGDLAKMAEETRVSITKQYKASR